MIYEPETYESAGAVSLNVTVGGLLSADVKDDTITFTVNGCPYYVLGEKVTTDSTNPSEIIEGDGQSVTVVDQDKNKNKDSDLPKTGDNSHMPLIISLLFVSGGAVMGAKALSKKREHSLK